MPQVTYSSLLTSGTVNGTAVVYGNSVDCSQSRALSLKVQAISASGTPDIRIDWEASDIRPAAEGSSDTNYVIPDDMTTPFVSLTDEVWHVRQIFPPPSTFGRPKITGNSGNPADSVVTAGIFIQK